MRNNPNPTEIALRKKLEQEKKYTQDKIRKKILLMAIKTLKCMRTYFIAKDGNGDNHNQIIFDNDLSWEYMDEGMENLYFSAFIGDYLVTFLLGFHFKYFVFSYTIHDSQKDDPIYAPVATEFVNDFISDFYFSTQEYYATKA